MIIRKATVEDQSAIFRLVETVLADYGLSTDAEQTDQDIMDLDDHYFNNKGFFAVIENRDKIIGSYGIYHVDDRRCELRKMYVYKAYQGMGLCKRLMDDAIAKAIELEYSEMILESNSLLGKALALYTKYGFEKVQPMHLSDRCDLVMLKKLS
jgi:putative acetyltransferase